MPVSKLCIIANNHMILYGMYRQFLLKLLHLKWEYVSCMWIYAFYFNVCEIIYYSLAQVPSLQLSCGRVKSPRRWIDLRMRDSSTYTYENVLEKIFLSLLANKIIPPVTHYGSWWTNQASKRIYIKWKYEGMNKNPVLSW